MTRFIVRSIISSIVTMLLVSMTLFLLVEVGSGEITVKLLGVFSTPEQRASYHGQLGLDDPAWLRYLDWLVGNDWRTESLVGHPLITIKNPQSKETEWWAQVDEQLLRWKMEKGELKELRRMADGTVEVYPESNKWQKGENGQEYFWGLDTRNNGAKWVRGAGAVVWIRSHVNFRSEGDGPQKFIPLRKGILRGDAGMSLQYSRPVSTILLPRIKNTAILAGVAFSILMPLALILGIFAGINEGKLLDRIISISSLAATATPEFVTGTFLIIIFGIWLKVLPAVALFTSDNAIFENPMLLALPVITLTTVDLGYIARMTRASMVEVMDSAYIRTAIVKGMPYWRVVIFHALRNALLTPITVIMLHVNWLVGNVVVVEVIFGYPGLGKYIYDAAIFGDYNAIEAAAMVTVGIAIFTRLVGDLAYTLLNPRIRYA